MRSLLPRLVRWAGQHDAMAEFIISRKGLWSSRVCFGSICAVLLRDGTGCTRVVTVASAVEYDQYPVLSKATPHQPRLDTVASCSGDPNLILRARQMSHCQRGQPLMSLCKTGRHGSSIKAGTHCVGCPQSLPGRLLGPFGRRRNVLVIIHRHGQEWAVCRLGRRRIRTECVTRRRVALGQESTRGMILSLSLSLCLLCYRIRISASVVLSSLGSIRGGPVGIGTGRRRRIAGQDVM